MNKLHRIGSLPLALAAGIGRWMIGAPPTRRPGRFRVWFTRLATIGFFAWLFVFGPGAMLAPRLFGFSVVSSNGLYIYYQGAVDKTLIADALQCAEQARVENLAFWGPPAGGVRPIDIYLCESRLRWQQLALWPGANAVAYGSSIFIAPLEVPKTRVFGQVVTHEMSHVFLNQRLGYLRGYMVPAWMNEGIATYVAQNFWATDESFRRQLNQSSLPQLVPAAELRSHIQWRAAFEGTPIRAALTYGHAQSLCAYLVREFGRDRVKHCLDSISPFASSDSTFKAAFAMSVAEADNLWLAEAKSARQIPQATDWCNLRLTFAVVALSLLPFALLAFAFVWLIRQVFLIARFFAARSENQLNPA